MGAATPIGLAESEIGHTDTLENAARRSEYWKAEHAAANKRITELEDLLFSMGAMEDAPCFCCGYNGPGYFQPGKHKCAERHHMLKRDSYA